MRTYRSTSSIVWGSLIVVVGAGLAVSQFLSSDRPDAGAGPALGLALAGAGIAVFLLPSIRIGTDVVEVHNVLQVVTVPFARLKAVEAMWTLELVGDDGRKIGVMTASTRARRGRRVSEQAPTPGAGAAVQHGWDEWRNRGGKPTPSRLAKQSAAFSRKPNLAGIICVILSFAAAVVAYFF